MHRVGFRNVNTEEETSRPLLYVCYSPECLCTGVKHIRRLMEFLTLTGFRIPTSRTVMFWFKFDGWSAAQWFSG